MVIKRIIIALLLNARRPTPMLIRVAEATYLIHQLGKGHIAWKYVSSTAASTTMTYNNRPTNQVDAKIQHGINVDRNKNLTYDQNAHHTQMQEPGPHHADPDALLPPRGPEHDRLNYRYWNSSATIYEATAIDTLWSLNSTGDQNHAKATRHLPTSETEGKNGGIPSLYIPADGEAGIWSGALEPRNWVEEQEIGIPNNLLDIGIVEEPRMSWNTTAQVKDRPRNEQAFHYTEMKAG
ncbi:hypothetical protein B0H11DRAFT_2235069 [Mycena galericulata]|nr:hypothetical protein B0H11DRAFT_2235069 [Mycena galericulata]